MQARRSPRRRFLVASSFALVTVSARVATALTIGLYSDLACSSCNLDLPPGGFGTLYVAVSNDQLPFGPSGAEFRITGLPPGWSATATPNPALQTVSGNPMQNGAYVRFPTGVGLACVRLYSVQIGVPMLGGQARLIVGPHLVPLDPRFSCPVVDLDMISSTVRQCAGGGQLLVNSPLACTVGVEPGTWSAVKRLFD
jgi:hypothetical protein